MLESDKRGDHGASTERLTREELSVWRSLIDTTSELRRLLSAEMQQTEVSPGDYAVLLALTEAPDGAIRSSRLADEIDWERSRLSHHLGRMERRNLVRRDDSPGDSRGALVGITEEGSAGFQRAAGPHLRAIKRYFAHALTGQQVADLADVLQSVQRRIDELDPTTGERRHVVGGSR